jgi:hypothetical protein
MPDVTFDGKLFVWVTNLIRKVCSAIRMVIGEVRGGVVRGPPNTKLFRGGFRDLAVIK